MEWGLLIVAAIVGVIAYVVIQETRAQRHWRSRVEAGDVDIIRQILETEIERWRTDRVPREVPASLWHGVQTVELLDLGHNFARVGCSAEGQYALVNGGRQEVSGPLDEGMKLTHRLADMLLYDIPNLRLARVQIDVYTTFRDESGMASQRCILTTIVDRSRVQDIDWDAISSEEFVRHCGGRFSADQRGAHPINPEEDALRSDTPASAQSVSGRTAQPPGRV